MARTKKEVILITGANGHLAKTVSQLLCKDYELRYLTTKRKLTNNFSHYYWNIEEEYIDEKAFISCQHIIHLAGYSILNRWSKKNKQVMYDSRVKSADLILAKCMKLDIKPETFICASAIGIYDQSIKISVNEDCLKGNNWLANMACDWESAANRFKDLGCRVVQMRISLIFSNDSGFLKYNLLSMKFGVGAIIGNSSRKISWIHVDDLARFILKCIKSKDISGAYNLSSENIISQKELFKTIKHLLFPYAIIIRIPISLIKLFLGSRSQIIDTNLSLNTKKLKNTGFKFKFKNFAETISCLTK